MQLTVSGKQIDVGEALQAHVEQSLPASIGKYFDNPVETHVVFSREGHLFRTDISVHVGRGITAQGRGEAGEPYGAFDAAVERVAKRLRRYKRRLRDHHKTRNNEPEMLEARSYVLRAGELEADAPVGENGEPIVVAEMTTRIPALTVGEAVMQMDLGDLQQFMFRNSAHGGLNMIYRRRDGNIGWIDPRGNRDMKR